MCRCFYVSPITSYQHTHSYTYQHTLSHTPSHTHQHIVPTKPDLGIITIVFSELIRLGSFKSEDLILYNRTDHLDSATR